jgi:ribonuclease PH
MVEIQGTAEGLPFTEEQLMAMLGLAKTGISRLVEMQKQAIA